MIDFLGRRYLLICASAVLLLSGPVAYLFGYSLRYHIDFTGGTEVRLSVAESRDIGDVRNAVKHAGFQDAVIQSIGSSGRGYLVTLSETRVGVSDELVSHLSSELNVPVALEGVELVGAGAGQEVRLNALFAIILTLFVLLGYIALRHSFAYGVGAVVALVHDLILLFGFLVIAKIPFSLHILAAVLALLGYSLNDTIVIFGRIRENAQSSSHQRDSAYDVVESILSSSHRRDSAYDVVKISLNEVLRRTLLTSFSTFLVLLPLIVLGGESVYHFALTMAVAIVIGTYSSVYVASPVMLYMSGNKL